MFVSMDLSRLERSQIGVRQGSDSTVCLEATTYDGGFLDTSGNWHSHSVSGFSVDLSRDQAAQLADKLGAMLREVEAARRNAKPVG